MWAPDPGYAMILVILSSSSSVSLVSGLDVGPAPPEVFLILGMCCTGTFTGIFASGFVEYLGATRRMQRETAKEERLRVMAMAVCVLQRRFRLRRQRAGEAPRRLELTMSRAARRRWAERVANWRQLLRAFKDF